MGDPILCRLGFHKWQNYGDQVVISWGEPETVYSEGTIGGWTHGADGLPPRKEERELHNRVVYEGKQCKRCGIKLKRRFVTNSDGTLSCVGWEPDTEETDKE
jgi:hypothetical protein